MGETKPGSARRHAQPPETGERTAFRNRDLGHALLPAEVLNFLARDYDEDAMVQAMAAGAGRLAHDLAQGARPTEAALPALWLVPDAERELALAEAGEVTRSRIKAWRRRQRPMTWRELRVLMLGLRVLDD